MRERFDRDNMMDESLFNLVLSSQKIEYATFDAGDKLIQHTPGLFQSCSPETDQPTITEIFPELVGCEQILDQIKNRQHEPLIIENIQGLCIKSGREYFDLHVHPHGSGLTVIIRDNTIRANLERLVWQRRNELDLMTIQLIQGLKEVNEDITNAYESTLEGWANALELRDYETKGHCQRVTDISVELAQRMGMQGEKLVDFRRGALLHDIGKMGIPDHILLKPGPLTSDEWDIMRLHPLYAGELLSRIPFLRPALVIPLYHHERWNGSGYPKGLKGEQIPLEARVFSVVDVWDALLSNRPYRSAWPEEKVLEYILTSKNIRFDPTVVDVFLKMIAG